MADFLSYNSWQMLLGLELRLLAVDDCEAWADRQILTVEDDRLLILLSDLVGPKCSFDLAITSLRNIVAIEYPAFDLQGQEAEHFARGMWFDRLQAYIDGLMTPHMICQMLASIEPFFDFPPWLGRMYDACDWVNADARREDFPAIRETAAKTLQEWCDFDPSKPANQ